MSARESIRHATSFGPCSPAAADRLISKHRAEVLTEAADVAEDMYANGINGMRIAKRLRAMAAAPAAPVPDTAPTTVECTCLSGPTLRDGVTLHSGYCATVVHAAWTPQREAAIRATATEGAGSLHSALGATVPNEDVLGLLAELDRVRAALKEAADEVAELDDKVGDLSARLAATGTERDALKQRLHEAAMARVWTNEDGKKFVFADDLTGPLLGITPKAGE